MAAIGAVIGGFVGLVAALLSHFAAVDVSPVAVYFGVGIGSLMLVVASSLAVGPDRPGAFG